MIGAGERGQSLREPKSPDGAVLRIPSRSWVVVGVCAVFGLVWSAILWGRVGYFHGDAALWLGEIERFSLGEQFYKDFDWPYPPLALTVLGLFGRVFGTDPQQYWIATSFLFVAICGSYPLLTERVLEARWLLPTTILTLFAALAYSNVGSASAPVGMYTPAAPLGLLLILLAASQALRAFHESAGRHSWLCGGLCALAWLSKQDFWLPALWLVLFCCYADWKRARSAWMRSALAFGAVLALGYAAVGVTIGWEWVSRALLPGALVGLNAGRPLPSWQRLTVDLIALAVLGALAAAFWEDKGTTGKRRAFGLCSVLLLAVLTSLYVVQFVRVGTAVEKGLYPNPQGSVASASADLAGADITRRVKRALRHLYNQLPLHQLPFTLPVAIAALLWLKRRELLADSRMHVVILLLGLSMATRVRRGFEYLEWFQVLFDIPLIYLVFSMFAGTLPQWKKAAALALLACFSTYAYWKLTPGPWSEQGRWVPLETPRGTIYVQPNIPGEFRAMLDTLDRIDPQRNASLFANGYTEAYSYFFRRKNATGATVGLWSRGEQANDRAVLLARKSSLILIHNSLLAQYVVPAARIELGLWDQPVVPSPFATVDEPFFARLKEGCANAGSVQGEFMRYDLYDCRRASNPAGGR